MATKIIDVTLATIKNIGNGVLNFNVQPKGTILCSIVRAVDDEQVFQSEVLYSVGDGQPIHPSGETHIRPDESLTYNVTRRLILTHFDEEAEGQLNQKLILVCNLTDSHVELGGIVQDHYFGPFNFSVRFDEIDGFKTIPLEYGTAPEFIEGGGNHPTSRYRIEVVFTLNLSASR